MDVVGVGKGYETFGEDLWGVRGGVGRKGVGIKGVGMEGISGKGCRNGVVYRG